MATYLGDLIDRVQQLADRVDTGYRARTLNAIDEAVQWLARRMPWDSLLERDTFVCPGGRNLILPEHVGKVVSLFDSTNSRKILPGDNWESRFPGSYENEIVGPPQEWREAGLSPVLSQPSTNETLVLSTTQSDGMTVRIQGLVEETAASGTSLRFRRVTESFTMAGVTEVSANTYVRILVVQKSRPTDATLNVAYGSQLQSRVLGPEASAAFPRLEIYPGADAGYAIEMRYFRRPERLNDEDSAIDPGINEQALLWRAVGNMHWMDNERDAAQLAWQRAEITVAELRTQEEAHGEEDHTIDPAVSYTERENYDGGGYGY